MDCSGIHCGKRGDLVERTAFNQLAFGQASAYAEANRAGTQEVRGVFLIYYTHRAQGDVWERRG